MYFPCITNLPAFFQRIRSCTGDVCFVDRSGNIRDLKQLAVSIDGLDAILCGARLENLEVHASSLEDRSRLIRYMSEMNRS